MVSDTSNTPQNDIGNYLELHIYIYIGICPYLFCLVRQMWMLLIAAYLVPGSMDEAPPNSGGPSAAARLAWMLGRLCKSAKSWAL